MKKLLFTAGLLVLSFRIFALTIYAPTLVSPLDNAVSQMPNALLDWSPVSAAVSYNIQIDTASSFSNPVLLSATGSAINASELMFGVKYYWRVRAIGVSDTSAWSTSRNFTVLTSFSLVSPNDSTFHCYPNQLLKWQTSPVLSGFSYFDVEVDTTLNFNSTLLLSMSVSGTLIQKNASELHFGTRYFWRVRGRHSLDTCDWSATRCLITLDTVTTSAPVDNAVNRDPNVQMQWENVGGATKYEYQTDTVNTFSSPQIFDGYINTFKAKADTLLFGKHYYWRVRALHNADTSGWSMVKSFNIINSPILTAPANGGSTWPTLAPLFKWTKINGVTGYELQLDTTVAYAHPTKYYPTAAVVTQQGASLEQGQAFYWKMRAISSHDTSAWSSSYSFTVPGVGVDYLTLNASNISVFPNPTNGNTFIRFESNDVSKISVSVVNILGKTIRQEVYNIGQGSNLREINLEGVASGIYFMKFTKDNSSFVQKLTIQ